MTRRCPGGVRPGERLRLANGEPGGGAFRAYDTLFTKFLPALKQAGLTDAEIRQITVTNPATAFAVWMGSRAGPAPRCSSLQISPWSQLN